MDLLFDRMEADLLSECERCTNHEERFILVLKSVFRYHPILLDQCERKNSLHSVKSREDGNQSFRSAQYYQAIQKYTESIVFATDSSDELALAYANRSATLFELQKFEDCLQDIDRALTLKYPDKLKTKLYKRKGLCLMKLGRPDTESPFEEALFWLEKMNLNAKEMNKNRNELRQLMSAPCAASKLPENRIQYPSTELIRSNPEIPCASDAVAIKYSEKFGRHLVATRKIKPGEILVLEKPYCLGLVPKHVYTHCSYCLEVSRNMIPCIYCTNVAYCSETCRVKAWDEYHEIECPITGPLLPFGFTDAMWMSLRAVIMATQKGANLSGLKQELIDVDCNTDPRTKGYSNDGKFHSDQYRSIYTLTSNIDKCPPYVKLTGALSVALLVCMLAGETTMFGKKLKVDHTLLTNSSVIFIGGLILKQSHAFYINMHSAATAACSLTRNQDEHGSAIMAVCSFMNHSCNPNTLKQWRTDGSLAVYAAHPIEEGEQVFDSYGPHFNIEVKSERQVRLDHWQFDCECRPCLENWPLMPNLPSYKRQPLPRKSRVKLDKIMRKFIVDNSAIQKGILENSPSVLKQLLELIELLFKLAQKPCGELAVATSMLKFYYEAQDVRFNYEPLDLSELAEERSRSYLWLNALFSRQ